jgi:hypothetical protein
LKCNTYMVSAVNFCAADAPLAELVSFETRARPAGLHLLEVGHADRAS